MSFNVHTMQRSLAKTAAKKAKTAVVRGKPQTVHPKNKVLSGVRIVR